ncbi:MAG: tRNA 2-thiouridine(34) synthase MnmA [Elusimicrobia bacterium]|nr:tRNA 2-thiouridine(34) synthase MnmA [Elusimicrobiota bacterium]
MSGGVDSSVAAALLVEQGHSVIGLTMRLLPKLETGFGCCGSPRDIDDAKAVCMQLGVPHYVLDLAKLFDRAVISPFVDDYARGRTPNPCVECNRSVKFGYLSRLAEAWGADAVATGHYARVQDGRLLQAVDSAKDQTYFLYSMPSTELRRVLFPVGELTKAQVRAKARGLGLSTAEKPESQEICFVPGRDYRAFVAGRAGEAATRPGDVKDTAGRVVGRHGGLSSYTVGQRKGLGAITRSGGPRAEPLYVVGLEGDQNTLVVGREEESFRRSLVAARVSWTAERPAEGFSAAVRVRHRHRPAAARVTPLPGERARVEFAQPQRAVAPGQAAVFYRDGEVLGGGTIEEALA